MAFLRPKHVAKYNLIVIIASCLDVCCVLTVHSTLYKFGIHNGMASLSKKKVTKLQQMSSEEYQRRV